MEWCAKQRAGTGIDGQDGIDKNWLSFSVRGHSQTARTAQAPSETAPTPPTAAQAFQERELVFVPRSCQVTRRSRRFVLHRVFDCCFFIILPWPQRPKNALTSTLTLSGSFSEHLNGGWFRNRVALSCDWCSVLQRAFSQSARKAVLFFSSIVLSCAAASHPAFFRYICHPVFVFFELRNLRFPSPTR